MKKIILLFLIVVSPLSSQEWQKVSVILESEVLREIRVIDAQLIVAAGGHGVVKLSEDGGDTWSVKRGDYKMEGLNCIDFNSDKQIFAGGDNGVFIKSSDKGDGWETIDLGVKKSLRSLSFSNSHGIIAGDGGTLMTSSDNGVSWQNVNLAFDNNFQKVKFIDSSTAICLGNHGICLKTTDMGASWKEINLGVIDILRCISVNPNGRIYVAGDNNALFHSDDQFENWEKIKPENITAQFYSILSVNDSILLAGIVDIPTALHAYSTDGGKNWFESLTIGLPLYSFDRAPGADEAYLCGYTQGWIMKIDLTKPLPPKEDFHYLGESIEWGRKQYNFGLVSGCGPDKLIAEDLREIFISNDSAKTWTMVHEKMPKEVRSIERLGDTSLVLFLDSSKYCIEGERRFYRHWPSIAKSTDMGASWNYYTFEDEMKTTRSVFFDENKGLFYGNKTKFYITSDGGGSWTEKKLPDDMSATDMQLFGPEIIYSVIMTPQYEYKLYKTIDYFETYEVYDFNIEDMSGPKIFFINENIGWLIPSTSFSKSGNRVYKTTDGGVNWELNYVADFKKSMVALKEIQFTDINNGICVGNMGNAFHTTDGGDSWIDKSFESSGPNGDLYYPEKNTAYLATQYEGVLRFDGNISNGVHRIKKETEFNIYPNPAKIGGKINIDISKLNSCQPLLLEIVDLNGRKIISKYINPNSEQISIEHGAIAQGSYFVYIMNEEVFNVAPLIIIE